MRRRKSASFGAIFLAAIALVVALKFPGVVDVVVFSTIVAPAAIFFPLMLALYWKPTNGRRFLGHPTRCRFRRDLTVVAMAMYPFPFSAPSIHCFSGPRWGF